MSAEASDLKEILERMKAVTVLVIGDIILDRYIWGSVERISPEAPVPVVAVQREEDRLGGAGNVVRNLCSIGAKVNLCGFIGDDDEGQIVLKELEKLDVDREGVMIDRLRPTTLKTRVIAHAQQVVRIDRESSVVQGVALQEGFAALVDAQVDGVDAIIVSDYGKGALSKPVVRKLSEAHNSERISLTRRPLVLDPHPQNYDIYDRVSVIKPNRKEAELATGLRITDRTSALEVATALRKRWGSAMALITLGEDGMVLVTDDKEDGTFLATAAKEVFDVSGAGDTVSAVFAAALAAGAEPEAAGQLANIAAGVVISEVGTVAIDPDRLRARLVTGV